MNFPNKETLVRCFNNDPQAINHVLHFCRWNDRNGDWDEAWHDCGPELVEVVLGWIHGSRRMNPLRLRDGHRWWSSLRTAASHDAYAYRAARRRFDRSYNSIVRLAVEVEE